MAETLDYRDPQGALSALATDPMLRQMLERQQKGYEQAQTQLGNVRQAAQAASEADEAISPLAAAATAAASMPNTPGGFGQLLAGIGGAYGSAIAAQKQREFARQQAILKEIGTASSGGLGTGATTAMIQDALKSPIMNIGGVGINRRTGTVIVPKPLEATHSKIYSDAYKAAVERKHPDPDGYAREQADNYIFSVTRNPTIAGSLYAQRPENVPMPSQGGPAPSAALPVAPQQPVAAPSSDAPAEEGTTVDLKPGTDVSAMLRQLDASEKEYVRKGDFAMAQEVQKARRAIQQHPGAGVTTPPVAAPKPAAAAPAPAAKVPGLTYKDEAAEAAKKTVAEETEKSSMKAFEEEVRAPASAIADTAKIMQEFNALGQAKEAMKAGKFKEFMGGEAGKWMLSVLPKDSSMARGIANAQEAEKLSAAMTNKILMAAKGVQTEGDAQRAKSQITALGTDPDANRYLEAYTAETARQLKIREQMARDSYARNKTWANYDADWKNSPIMTQARGSVKKIGDRWVGLTQYIESFKRKNPTATDSDAVKYWNGVK